MAEISKLKTSSNTISMIIDIEYPTFKKFYDNEKHNIYIKIVDLFEKVIEENIEKNLLVVAKIDGDVFDTTFDISKSNKKLFTEKISPYFESIEEYEVCEKIKELLSRAI